MPNYVRNIVKMKDITYMPLFTADDSGEPQFDFGKLIPMPESLNLKSGSLEDDAICALVSKLKCPMRIICYKKFNKERAKEEV